MRIKPFGRIDSRRRSEERERGEKADGIIAISIKRRLRYCAKMSALRRTKAKAALVGTRE